MVAASLLRVSSSHVYVFSEAIPISAQIIIKPRLVSNFGFRKYYRQTQARYAKEINFLDIMSNIVIGTEYMEMEMEIDKCAIC